MQGITDKIQRKYKDILRKCKGTTGNTEQMQRKYKEVLRKYKGTTRKY